MLDPTPTPRPVLASTTMSTGCLFWLLDLQCFPMARGRGLAVASLWWCKTWCQGKLIGRNVSKAVTNQVRHHFLYKWRWAILTLHTLSVKEGRLSYLYRIGNPWVKIGTSWDSNPVYSAVLADGWSLPWSYWNPIAVERKTSYIYNVRTCRY